MTTYNHAFTIAFEVITKASCETKDDYPTPDVVRSALIGRLSRCCDDELMEAVGCPYDTHNE